MSAMLDDLLRKQRAADHKAGHLVMMGRFQPDCLPRFPASISKGGCVDLSAITGPFNEERFHCCLAGIAAEATGVIIDADEERDDLLDPRGDGIFDLEAAMPKLVDSVKLIAHDTGRADIDYIQSLWPTGDWKDGIKATLSLVQALWSDINNVSQALLNNKQVSMAQFTEILLPRRKQ